MTTKISYGISLLTGLALLFLGTRMILFPGVSEAAYGIRFNAQGDNSFHNMAGIRDIFSGLVICIFVLINERRALGVTLLAGTILPVTDIVIVMSKSYNGVQQTIPHIVAILICAVLGIVLLTTQDQKVYKNKSISRADQ